MELSSFLECLRRGEVVACPTETFHGLLADALSESAVGRVVALKRRGPDPIALLLPDLTALELVAEPLPPEAATLARRHWPGPLTLVVRARPGLPAALTRGGTVGVRVPGESPALALTRAFGGPLTATSANLSGQPPARTAAQVRAAFGDDLPVVDGDSPGGAASTLVDVTSARLRVLRQGAIAIDAP